MNKLLYVIIAAVAVLTGVVVYKESTAISPPAHALYYQESREIKSFSMTDHHGQVFNNQSLKGKWSWIFFGYTSCPDVCPTTLQELNFSYKALQAISPNNQVILVTVDPQRDSQDKLAQYIGYFNPEFIALRAEHNVLFPFARNVGLMYAIVDDGDAKANDSYLVDHSASIVLVNPEGRVNAIFKPTHVLGQVPTIRGKDLVSDFKQVVQLSQQQ